ncbi:Uncharacterised protein [Porphyromonas cangingivalis]|uniref:YecA family protein n=1 Tax=Porphyromonas cangingivalis TaxID=36874 RepID=UPI000D871804|nr:SEC-C domain-containing protein [Porphyromonas cangingivalis]SPY35875.1 Uncharacterised protein [Porphyromonas cangingivalis]
MAKKQGRNELCECGSGIKYKYCCINKELKPRMVKTDKHCSCGGELSIDLTNDWLNYYASSRFPMLNFCKDNDIYLFGLCVTVEEMEEWEEKLKTLTLTKEDILNTYKKNFKKDAILGLLDTAIEEMSIFKKRKDILKDAFEAHFDKKYTLTVPTLFAQLEGLLREVGGLKNKDNIKPTITLDNWDENFAFSIKDNAQYFNGFISKLFEGSKDGDSLNRNPILHGFDIQYYSEENSMLIMLSILEIRMFDWWEKHLPKYNFNLKK